MTLARDALKRASCSDALAGTGSDDGNDEKISCRIREDIGKSRGVTDEFNPE